MVNTEFAASMGAGSRATRNVICGLKNGWDGKYATTGDTGGEGQIVEKEALGEGAERIEDGTDFFFLVNKPMSNKVS